MEKILCICVTFLFSSQLEAQFNFEYSNEISVKVGMDTLKLPWAGGLNYAQFSDFDYDFDGDLDLFVFDRSSNNIRVFSNEIVNSENRYVLETKTDNSFPSDIRYRATMVDYNNDGKKDLFAYGVGGIKVYKNTGSLSTGLQWEVAKDLLYSDNWGMNLNLYVSSADIPAIVDVDFDGDIDVLTFHIGGEHMQYHQNQSMELYGIPDSLEFKLMNECWGGFREDLNTSSLYLNDPNSPCLTGNIPGAELPEGPNTSEKKPTTVEPKHSGSTVLALDYDNSGVMDLVLGDVSFNNLNLLFGKAGNIDKSQKYAEKAIESSPNNSVFLFNMATRFRYSNPKKSIELLEKAYKINQNSPTICYLLGSLLGGEKGNSLMRNAFNLWQVKLMNDKMEQWDYSWFSSCALDLGEIIVYREITKKEKELKQNEEGFYNVENLMGMAENKSKNKSKNQ